MGSIPADRDKITLNLIDNALKRGVTWTALAEALQVPDKRAAKRRHRELQRAVSLRTARENPAIHR